MKISCLAAQHIDDCKTLITEFADDDITAAADIYEMISELKSATFHNGNGIVVTRIFQSGNTPSSDPVAAYEEIKCPDGLVYPALRDEIDHLRSSRILLGYLGLIWKNRELFRSTGFWQIFFFGLPSKLRDAFLTSSLKVSVNRICHSRNLAAAIAESSTAEIVKAACGGDLEALNTLVGGDPLQMNPASLRVAFWRNVASPTSPWVNLQSAIQGYPVEMNPHGKCQCVRNPSIPNCLFLLVDFIEIFGEIDIEDKTNLEAVLYIFGKYRNTIHLERSRQVLQRMRKADVDNIYLASKQIGLVKHSHEPWKCRNRDGLSLLGSESRKSEPFNLVLSVINGLSLDQRSLFWQNHLQGVSETKALMMKTLDQVSFVPLRPWLAAICAEPAIVALLSSVKPESHPEKSRILRLCRELPIDSSDFYSSLNSDQSNLIRLAQSSRNKATVLSAIRSIIRGTLLHKYIRPCRNFTSCPICADEQSLRYAAVTECGHSFCGSCFYAWFTKNKTCPVCREDLLESSETAADFAAVSP